MRHFSVELRPISWFFEPFVVNRLMVQLALTARVVAHWDVATLPRISHVVHNAEKRGTSDRVPAVICSSCQWPSVELEKENETNSQDCQIESKSNRILLSNRMFSQRSNRMPFSIFNTI
jgi:hypothetical protein